MVSALSNACSLCEDMNLHLLMRTKCSLAINESGDLSYPHTLNIAGINVFSESRFFYFLLCRPAPFSFPGASEHRLCGLCGCCVISDILTHLAQTGVRNQN